MPRRPIVHAVLLGGLAGALVTVDGRLAAGLCLVAIVVAVTAKWGVARLTEVAWLAAAALAPMNGLRVAGSATFCDVALIVAAAGTIATAIAGGRPVSVRPPDPGLLGGLMLIVLAGVFGTVFAANSAQSLVDMSKFLVAAAGSLFAIALWCPSAAELRRFCWAWLIGALLNVAWAATGNSPRLSGRPQGFTTHSNHLGLVCVLGLGIALGLAASASGRERLIARMAMAALVAGVLISGSRAAVIGVLVVVPVWSILSTRWTLALRCLAGIAVLAIALGFGIYHLPADSGAQRLLGGATSTASDTARVQLLHNTEHRISHHPLTGEGFQFALEAHNIYLEALVIGGPLALLGLGLVATSVVRPGLRIGTELRHGPVDRRLLLPVGMVAGYAGYLVDGLFQNILWDRYLWLFIAAAVALSIVVTADDNSVTSSVT